MSYRLNKQNSRARSLLAIAMIIMAVLLLFAVNFIQNPFSEIEYYGRVIDIPAPDFQLRDLEGQDVQMRDFQGQYVFLMFGYLNCTSTCHSQALVLNHLSDEVTDKDVHFVYISMDPQRDDAKKLQAYFKLKNYDRLTILRGGSIKKMQSVANAFKAPFSIKQSVTGEVYEISHPGYVFLINPGGRLSMVYSGNWIDTDRLIEDLAKYKAHYS